MDRHARWLNAKLEGKPFRVKIPYKNGLFACNLRHYAGPWIVAPHYHQDIEILLSLGIQGEMRVNGKPYPIQPGKVLVAPSESIHAFQYRSGESGDILVLQVSTEGTGRLFDRFFKGASRSYEKDILQVSVHNPEWPATLSSKIIRLTRENGKENPSLASTLSDMAALSDILHALLPSEGGSRNTIPASDPRIHRIIDVIEKSAFLEETTLDEIAKASALSKFHLCRIFRQGTGMTVHAYRNTLRVTRAARLLKKGASVTETADACGYASLPHFIQMFRKAMAVTPKQWALSVRSRER